MSRQEQEGAADRNVEIGDLSLRVSITGQQSQVRLGHSAHFRQFFVATCRRCDNLLSPASATVVGVMRLIDKRTRDGSRRFARLPWAAAWADVRDHALLLPNAEIVNFVDLGYAQPWLDFHFRRHRFLIRVRNGLLRLSVRDPQCPDLILYEVGHHFERLLGKPGADKKPLPPRGGRGLEPVPSRSG